MHSSSGVSKPLLVAVIAGIAVVAVVLGFTMLAPSGQPSPITPPVEPPQSREFRISSPLGSAFPDNELNYDPADLTVNIGDTITWSNDDENIHTATHRSDPALFDSGTMEAGDEFSFTFSEEGEVRYFCRFHPWMTGVVTVQN